MLDFIFTSLSSFAGFFSNVLLPIFAGFVVLCCIKLIKELIRFD